MRISMSGFRCRGGRNLAALMMAGAAMLCAAQGSSRTEPVETIQSTYANSDSMVSVVLTIHRYSTAADLQAFSKAFAAGQDQGLVLALSKAGAVGSCSITGLRAYDVAFIQMTVTATGRKITFIASRPLQFGEARTDGASQSFDLAVGEFNINDLDAAKSTGYLYPASKLAIDEEGQFHYNLAGEPWKLINVLELKVTPETVLVENSPDKKM